MTLRQLAIEVNKSVTKINSKYFNELFMSKQFKYNHRNVSVLEGPNLKWTPQSLAWNPFKIMVLKYKIYFFKKYIFLGELRHVMKSLNGHNCKCPVYHIYIWNVNITQNIWTAYNQINQWFILLGRLAGSGLHWWFGWAQVGFLDKFLGFNAF